MACSITHKKFMLVRPSERGSTCLQKSENRNFRIRKS